MARTRFLLFETNQKSCLLLAVENGGGSDLNRSAQKYAIGFDCISKSIKSSLSFVKRENLNQSGNKIWMITILAKFQ